MAQEIERFAARLDPSCDLEPLGKLHALRELKLSGKSRGFAPLAAAPLASVELVELTGEGQKVDEVGLRELGSLGAVAVLRVSVGADVDLAPLEQLTALRCLHLAAGNRQADSVTARVLHTLYDRGVYVSLYEHEGWPLALDIPHGVGSGLVTLEKNAGD